MDHATKSLSEIFKMQLPLTTITGENLRGNGQGESLALLPSYLPQNPPIFPPLETVMLTLQHSQTLYNTHQIKVHYIYPIRRGFIYWTDSARGLIMRSNLDGTSVSTPLNTGLTRPGECQKVSAIRTAG